MVEIDYTRDERLTEVSILTLKDRYMVEGETSPQDCFMRASKAFASNDAHAQRMYDYISKGWLMYSTPILSNGGTKRGQPIACFGGYVDDSRTGITDHYTENAWLSSMGGGIGGYWGHIRSNGEKTSNGSSSSGIIPFIKVVDSMVLAFSQGGTRRGSYAAYLDISHPEILEFLTIRKPTGGDSNRKSLNLHNAVIISDEFMRKVVGEDPNVMFNLIDPHTKNVVGEINAKETWEQILTLRVETGEPYIMFGDTVNDLRPKELRDLGLRINQSNLCSEITLPTNKDRTFVCCLSSLNLEKFPEWKDSSIVEDLVEFLDNVLTFFISTSPESMAKAKNGAELGRDIGIGTLGWHSYLQRMSIPFESVTALSHLNMIHKHIMSCAMRASQNLGKVRGFAPDTLQGSNPRRNTHLIAIAPNASSGLICGTSPSVEPLTANIFTQKTLSGSFEIRNPYLQKLLSSYGKDTEETWKSIRDNGGSVQHLKFISPEEKEVFKTASEINQRWVIEQASHRQKYIDQAQSINLFFSPVDGTIDALYLHQVHTDAWKKGLKTLYYLRSKAIRKADNIGASVERQVINTEHPATAGDCVSCEG
jgi:ribonucleoside-diphosphate reductase alpha chain